jgi:hypothetical protein
MARSRRPPASRGKNKKESCARLGALARKSARGRLMKTAINGMSVLTNTSLDVLDSCEKSESIGNDPASIRTTSTDALSRHFAPQTTSEAPLLRRRWRSGILDRI